MKERVLFTFPPKHVGIKIVPFVEVGLMERYATHMFCRVVPFVNLREGMEWVWNCLADILGLRGIDQSVLLFSGGR